MNILSSMTISIIAAVGNERQIGLNNKLPWKLSGDLENFKRLTVGNVVIFGRKTFESIGRPLPNRTNAIITKQKDYKVDGAFVFNSLEDAVENFKDKNIFIGGGQKIYEEALSGKYKIDNLYITFVDYNGDADRFFPQIDFTKWKLATSDSYKKDNKNNCNYRIETFKNVLI